MVYSPNYQYATKLGSTMVLKEDGLQYSVFNASMTLRIPSQPIRYFPTTTTILKDAWVKYMAFFIVVAFLIFRLNSLVFRNKVNIKISTQYFLHSFQPIFPFTMTLVDKHIYSCRYNIRKNEVNHILNLYLKF